MNGNIEKFGDVWKLTVIYPTQEEAVMAASKLPKKFRESKNKYHEVVE